MYCVILGDIVQSKAIASKEKELVRQKMKEALDSINVNYSNCILADFGLVRGDAFEGVLFTQRDAPQIIQVIIKSIYGISKTKIRISAVMDELSKVSSDRNEADGPAFYTAIKEIDRLKKQKSDHWLQVSFITKTIAQGIVESLVDLLTALTGKWTDRQREIAWAMDDHGQQIIVSKKLEISPAVVNKQLKAAHYDVYRLAWKNLTAYLEKAEEDSISRKPKEEPGYTAYYSVAVRKAGQREYAKAIPLFEKALELAKTELGDSNPQLASIYNELAKAYIENEEYQKASQALDTSFALQEQLPKARWTYAWTKNLSGALFEKQKKYGDALRCYSEAKEIAISALGPEHPAVHGLSDNIANIHRQIKAKE